nr:hypothetical protein [Pantoea stewartii]
MPDRPRINARQTIVNGRLGLADERTGEPAGAGHAVRASESEAGCPVDYTWFAVLGLIRGLKTRRGITEALEAQVLSGARLKTVSVLPARTKGETSDSGAIYEQSFNAEGPTEIEVQQQTTGGC